MIKRIFESYKRLRHTKGFGVHSPMAYSVVKQVISLGNSYAYYGYSEIDHAARCGGGCRRSARILLRLASHTDVRDAWIPHSAPTIYKAALMASRSDIRLRHGLENITKCDMMCSDAALTPLSTLCEYVSAPGRTLALRNAPEEWQQKIFDAMEGGIMLYGKRNLIIITREEMQKVSYSIIL